MFNVSCIDWTHWVSTRGLFAGCHYFALLFTHTRTKKILFTIDALFWDYLTIDANGGQISSPDYSVRILHTTVETNVGEDAHSTLGFVQLVLAIKCDNYANYTKLILNHFHRTRSSNICSNNRSDELMLYYYPYCSMQWPTQCRIDWFTLGNCMYV